MTTANKTPATTKAGQAIIAALASLFDKSNRAESLTVTVPDVLEEVEELAGAPIRNKTRIKFALECITGTWTAIGATPCGAVNDGDLRRYRDLEVRRDFSNVYIRRTPSKVFWHVDTEITVDHPELRDGSFKPVPVGFKCVGHDFSTREEIARAQFKSTVEEEWDFNSEFVSKVTLRREVNGEKTVVSTYFRGSRDGAWHC